MTKKISGAEYPIAKIFSSDFDYLIPTYQRPYAWTTVQAGELFADLHDFYIKEKEDTYFLGSIVLIKEEGKPLAEVIDGQQRLTTLTILLSALTHRATGNIRDSFNRYLCEPGNELEGLAQKPRLTLRERDRIFFKDYVQAVKLDELLRIDPAQLDNESQRNIQANARLFMERLQSTFGDDPQAATDFGSFLVRRCFLVAVSTPSQQAAFRVFSILNSRGLDLLPTDIIKSDVIGKVRESLQSEYNETWEDLEVEAGRDGFAEVFGHIRMIYAKEKARRALLEEFRERVIDRVPSAENLVTQVIVPYTQAYLLAKNCEYVSTSNAAEINALLKWLNRIDNSDWLPSAMKFFAEHQSDAAYVNWFVTRLERLAAYMHICGYDVNGRIDRYALVLKALEQPHSLSKPVAAVELTLAEKQRFLTNLQSEIYWLTARRRNYLILRLDSFLSDGAAVYDPSVLTIEHVLPQTVAPDSEWAAQWPDATERLFWLHRLANLVPLTQRRNSQAQNFEFERKKKAYFGGRQGVSSYILTTQVLATPAWSPEVVRGRQQELVDVLTTGWGLTST
ncbi:DUF262 domain-containing protein [Silvimonas iriomotensis]|uniref:DUF262 domain-containing protein n=1 Tax=Silvimonas iriomotensis TaxID=449662 RepID=A0ABQ2PAP4_9NEIS|nr:DUF262 domain-containing protein [Silvimonas iriomotensis]GGP21899.1 hypothetical protein GCM10010970_22760 [Silvimonas iriomotensis]